MIGAHVHCETSSSEGKAKEPRLRTTCLVLLVLITISWLPRSSGPIDLRWDAAVYYILGTSLAEGKGYRLLNEPGEIEAVQYPPLLPLIVAAHQRLLGTTDFVIVGRWLRGSFFLFFVAYIFAVHAMLRIHLPWKYAFFATLLCLFNLHTYFLSDLCFPEIPFALATVLFFIFHGGNSARIHPILAALFLMAAYALRTVAIALFAAWIAESLFKKEFKRTAVRLALSAIPIVGWQSYIYNIESGPEYNRPAYAYQRAEYAFYNVSYAKNIFKLKDAFSPELGYASFEDITRRVLNNVTEIPISLGGAVTSAKEIWELPWKLFSMPFPLNSPWPVYLVLTILGCLILGGVALQLLRRQWIISLYILLSLTVVCVTPWPGQFSRYLVPLAPVLALSLFSFLRALEEQSYKVLPTKWKSAGFLFTNFVVVLILVQQSVTFLATFSKWHPKVTYEHPSGQKIEYRLFFYHEAYRALDTGLDWLKSRAHTDEVVAVSMPHWAYLRTGLKAVLSPFEPNPTKAQILLDSVPVKYLILDEGLAVDTKKYTFQVVRNFPDLWIRLYSASIVPESGKEPHGRFEIYERVGTQRTSGKQYREPTPSDS